VWSEDPSQVSGCGRSVTSLGARPVAQVHRVSHRSRSVRHLEISSVIHSYKLKLSEVLLTSRLTDVEE